MTKSDFVAVFENFPKPPVAVFTLTKVPGWLSKSKHNIEVGEEILVNHHGGMYHLRTGLDLEIGHTYLKFMGYR